MKNITVYPTIWQTLPYSFYMEEKTNGFGRKTTKDIVLRNKEGLEKGVSEMSLNTIKLSVIDINGNEHVVSDFKNQLLLLKGLHTGVFIKSNSGLGLSEGEYRQVRFYLDTSNNSYKTLERTTEDLYNVNCLDFEIEEGLKIQKNESCEVVLRFDLNPYSFLSNFNPLKMFLNKYRIYPNKLARSFES